MTFFLLGVQPYRYQAKPIQIVFQSFLFYLSTMMNMKNNFHVLNKILICQRKEYQSCTCPIGTISVEVLIMYTLIPLSRLLRGEHHIILGKLYLHLDTIWTHFFIPCTLKEHTHTVKSCYK